MEQHLYVVLDNDDDGRLVAKKTSYTMTLELFSQQGIFPTWTMPFMFGNIGGNVTIYGATFSAKPTGENLEEVERLVLKTILED